MVEEEGQQGDYYELFSNASVRMRDVEEKQNILKERILLIGKNFLESKETGNAKIIEIKKDIENIKQDMEKIKSFLESMSNEFSKFARKEDLDLLSKQAKMFQPLNLIKKTNKNTWES